MRLQVAAILDLKITVPLALIADVIQPRPHAGHDAGVAAAQQADNGGPPDGLHGLFEFVPFVGNPLTTRSILAALRAGR